MNGKGSKFGGKLKAASYAVIVHALVIGILVVSFQWPTDTPSAVKPAQEEIVQAVVVDEAKVQQELDRLKRKEEQKKQQELKRKKRLERMLRQAKDAERKRKLEEKRLAKLKKKRRAEKKKTEELAKKRRAEEKQLSALKKNQAEEEKRIATRKKQEAERKRRAEAKRRKERERAMQLALEQEKKERQARAAFSKYVPIIQQKVDRNWIRPAMLQAGLKTTVRVKLMATGEVVDVKVVRSSGDEIFDRSVQAAIYKATPLPLPREPGLAEYFREIQFDFDPSKG